MQKYKEGSTVEIVGGKHKGKKGYIDRYDKLDNTYLVIDGIPETTKFRISEDDIHLLNTNYFLWGYTYKEDIEDIDIQRVANRVDDIKEANWGYSILDKKKGERVIAKEYSEKLCFSCLKECEDIKEYKLGLRGYGSSYDGTCSKLQLCGKCRESIDVGLDKIFNEVPEKDEHWEDYKYEDILRGYINTLPLEGQELFENTLSQGWTCHKINAQDWLDIITEVASDSVYKRNNLYSPSERDAYYSRFSRCKHTYIKNYSDGSRGSYCNIHSCASGKVKDKDGVPTVVADDYNISDECYYCTHFEIRDDLKTQKTSNVLEVKLNKVTMFEYYCPNCGTKKFIYESDIVNKGRDYDYCDECFQEVCFTEVRG